ncbi:MAG: hypothetical protein J6Z23_05800 [Lachnospiraceae bacterium]|nr:hypothetical protein [Lachnospiraceae bacterium]MBP5254877.1 hypothetical protein [Lachnospiraceae bacterium]
MFRDFSEKAGKAVSAFFRNRLLVLGVLMGLLLIGVVARLFQLQIINGEAYYDNYVNMTRKEVSIPAMRGNIYDRNGNLLAGNRVVYSVTIIDGNYYSKSTGAFNEMLLELIRLLESCGEDIRTTLPVIVNDRGEYEYSGSAAKIRLLIRDVYGTERIEKLAEEGIDAYAYDVDKVMEDLKAAYNFTSRWPAGDDLAKEDVLKICHIRYGLAATAFTRYISTVVSSDVDEVVRAAVLESQYRMNGVNVEETYERVYYNVECFSGILGYVGSITTEEIEELNAQGGDYIAGDVIGKEGIESAYENYLQGRKGSKLVYVNNTGMILYEEVLEEPVQGNDVYLSVDQDMTIVAYNVMEQQLAGVIVNHLYSGTDYDPQEAYNNSSYLTPVRDVYFQMVNNNILSIAAFAAPGASRVEQGMEQKRAARKRELLSTLGTYLRGRDTAPLSESDPYMQAYIRYFYTWMSEKRYLIPGSVDTSDSVYQSWRAGGCSFPDFLYHALAKGWVDTSVLGEEARYSTVETCYRSFAEILITQIGTEYGAFDKLIYDELIHRDVILGTEIGIALYEQGFLKYDETEYRALENGDNDTAFEFFKSKITTMELSPAQIALDPCSAGVVLTDPNTGELLAVVSYPGYDANRINDAAYYNRLLNDLSSPLYSRATQSRLAPGSTFKMITATAALEEGYLATDEPIVCEGIFDKLDHPRCWIYRTTGGAHGPLDVVHALGQSCNCFFYELGYRFSQNAAGFYSPSLGISVINKYASMYGFGSLTGIETSENVSVITTELPVTSAIGQGTNAFTTISLARYVTALASSGNVYEFRLLNRITGRGGDTLISYTPLVSNRLEFSDSTWNAIHEGMYTVVHEGGSRSSDFQDLRYHYAAKSGSAQENRNRPEHGLYVSYGPYNNIQYAMAVQIPNGYSAGNAALITKGIYEYLEGDITMEEILENGAATGGINDVAD